MSNRRTESDTRGRAGGEGGGRRATRPPPRWRSLFIRALQDTGIVLAACQSARVARRTVYEHRKAEPEFKAAWQAALEDAIDHLEGEARRRAVEGTRTLRFFDGKPLMVDGKRVYDIEYSDQLLALLLRAHRPEKFRDHHKLTVDGSPGNYRLPADGEAAAERLSAALSELVGRDDASGAGRLAADIQTLTRSAAGLRERPGAVG